MNDGHYFINCRLIVCQDGEDVWNKLWNFEPGPGSDSGSGWVAREMSRKYLQATAGAGARWDKHCKLKYLNCELKFSLRGKMTWIIKSLRNISLSFLASQQPERAEIIRELEPFLSRYFLPVPGPASGWHPHLSTEQTLQARNNPIIVFISFYGKRLETLL